MMLNSGPDSIVTGVMHMSRSRHCVMAKLRRCKKGNQLNLRKLLANDEPSKPLQTGPDELREVQTRVRYCNAN